MRHALFNRNNPPPQTVWQRRRAAAKRAARNVYALAADTWQNARGMAYMDPAAMAALVAIVWREQLADAPLEPGEPARAWINFVIQIAIVIVAAVVAAAMAPKPPMPKPAALSEFDVPTAEEGRPIAKVFGEVWITSPNNLWYGDLSSEPIKKKGGKK